MKKISTLTIVALFAMIGLRAQATMNPVGDELNGSVTNGTTVMADGETTFNPAELKFAVTGAAFGGWNMPPSANQVFTNNGDGTYTLEYEGATTADFKLSCININEDFSSWSVFDTGVMGASNLASGDNALSTSYGTSNMKFPVSGNVTLTISNVTETGCNLNIILTEEIVPDKAYYLIGEFNGWDESTMVPFVEENGVFTLTKTFGGEFKVKDENGNWWGGGVTLTKEEPSVTLVDGGNLVLEEEDEYTLTIENGVLTVTFPTSAITTLSAGDNVASVKYVSTTGMISDTPFQGVNIMVVTYQDGSRKSVKLVK